MAEEIEYRRPWMYEKQERAFFCDARYSVTEASTKSGKTVGSLLWIAEQAMKGKPGQNYWWVAPVYSQSEIGFRRLKGGLPHALRIPNESKLTLLLANGTMIWFKSGEKPDNLYGEDVYAAVIEEASRLREESWTAVRSTLTYTRGPIRLIGNVKGRRNWFYRMARQAEAGEPNMEYHRITWRDAVEAGILDIQEIEDARRRLPTGVFGELYEAEAADDEGNPFGIDAIRACIKPISSESPVAWGWDLAKSTDYTVGIGLDANKGVSKFLRFQKPWQETFDTIMRETGKVKASVDSTGVGDPILERLEREGGHNYEGYKYTSESKQKLMEGLAVAIQGKEISFPDGPIVSELESFEYEYTRTGVKYTAPPGMHDDCVCSLAQVNMLMHSGKQPIWSAPTGVGTGRSYWRSA